MIFLGPHRRDKSKGNYRGVFCNSGLSIIMFAFRSCSWCLDVVGWLVPTVLKFQRATMECFCTRGKWWPLCGNPLRVEVAGCWSFTCLHDKAYESKNRGTGCSQQGQNAMTHRIIRIGLKSCLLWRVDCTCQTLQTLAEFASKNGLLRWVGARGTSMIFTLGVCADEPSDFQSVNVLSNNFGDSSILVAKVSAANSLLDFGDKVGERFPHHQCKTSLMAIQG